MTKAAYKRICEFQSTHPLRGATIRLWTLFMSGTFQSTHPLRGATEILFDEPIIYKFQSTHPLRGATRLSAAFYPLPVFQSTHPLRGATVCNWWAVFFPIFDFNPRTPCGVRQAAVVAGDAGSGISIHAPLAGCDTSSPILSWSCSVFQSTHPLRGATSARATGCTGLCGFQSTHPLRGATSVAGHGAALAVISIHAPLAGCDKGVSLLLYKTAHFNPRTPCGVRRAYCCADDHIRRISIHAPLAGCDGDIADFDAETA